MKKLLTVILTVLAIAIPLASCAKDKAETAPEETENTQQEQTSDTASDELYADAINFTIELENGGIMKGELYPNLAPKTVENFVKLAKSGFYDGLIFHRVINGFMIQGGGYDADMNPKETSSIEGEFSANGFENPLKHTKGVISMARTQDPNSASGQFFIVQNDSPHLDGQYAAFGRVIEGFDIIDEIAGVETSSDNKYRMDDFPVEPIVIKTITIG